MPFKRGESGNPNGRPKGSLNKTTYELRSLISDFLNSNFDQVTKDFDLLQPKDRLKYYCELLNFGLPRLQTSTIESIYDGLPDSQLDQIINGIIKNSQN